MGQEGCPDQHDQPRHYHYPLARQELASDSAAGYQEMIDHSASGRMGTPDEVAQASAFLLSDAASFVTGTDLLIDGGVIAAMRNHQIKL